jgi:H+-transporting ATPase
LLNDGAILSIAYDNVHCRNAPEAWNMRLVLGIATVLGLVGPIAAFGLFYLGDRVFQLGHPQLQTMMYLMLSVAGHLTIFQTRTRGPWWSTRPAWILLGAVCGTQTLATLVAVYGLGLVTPLGWMYAGIVWAYAFAWFLVTDPVKLLAYRVLDTVKADTTTQAKAEPQPDTTAIAKAASNTAPKVEGKSEPKAEPAPDTKAEPKPEAKSEPKAKAPATVAASPKSGDNTQPTFGSTPKPKPTPQPAQGKDNVTALFDRKLGDVLLEAVLKDPADAGRLIAKAISDAEPQDETAKPTETEPTTPVAPTPQAAE